MKRLPLAVLLCAAFCSTAAIAQNFTGAADLDAVINQAIREDKIPGAVVLVGHNGQVVYRKRMATALSCPPKSR